MIKSTSTSKHTGTHECFPLVYRRNMRPLIQLGRKKDKSKQKCRKKTEL